MGKKGNWFGAVKKAFSPEPKEKKSEKEQKTPKSKKKWGFYKQQPTDLNSIYPPETCNAPNDGRTSAVPPPSTPAEEINKMSQTNDQNKKAYSMALATVEAAEAAIIAANAAAEVVRLTSTGPPNFVGKSREENAAIKIQTVFRGYLARRALRALKGLVRLKSLVYGDSVKRQTATTLQCMQTLTRVQSEIRNRRIRMTEENQALQRHLQLKREKELEALKASMGENWDDSLQSKEEIEANITSKHEAAMKRERALAYAYTHQWKSSSRSVNPMFTDPNNPNWGWCWLERWMASRPLENRSATAEKEANKEQNPAKNLANSNAGEIVKAYARRHSPSSPALPARRKTISISSAATRPPELPDDDNKSMVSTQSEWNRRHSIAGSSVRDDESMSSLPSIPSYMTPTESARAKSRFQSPLSDMVETPEKSSAGSVKKRLSFPAGKGGSSSPAVARRHSGPPKVNVSSISTGNGCNW